MSNYPSTPTGRIDETPQGRQLTIERTFRAPIGEVWTSLTAPESVARWYGIIEGDQVSGGTIMITMTAEEGAPSEPAHIIECDPPNGFIVETAGMGDPWRLHLSLREADGVTTLTFIQILPAAFGPGDIGAGWEFYADRHHAALNGNTMPDWEADEYQKVLGPYYDGL